MLNYIRSYFTIRPASEVHFRFLVVDGETVVDATKQKQRLVKVKLIKHAFKLV